MARPTRNVISSGIAAWDSDVDTNFSIITDTPFPIYRAATTSALPSASSYEDCLALIESSGRLYISDGTSWSLYDRQAAYQADSTATTVADMVTDFNSLLDKLRTSHLMASS